LLLLPSERAFVELLEQRKVPVEEMQPNHRKLFTIKSMLAAQLARDADLKYLAQRAFVSYFRSIFLQKNKAVFDVHQLPAAEFAESIGLSGTPRLKFGKKKPASEPAAAAVDRAAPATGETLKNNLSLAELQAAVRQEMALLDGGAANPVNLPSLAELKREKKKKKKTKLERLLQRTSAVTKEPVRAPAADGDDSDDDLLVLKRRDHALDGSAPTAAAKFRPHDDRDDDHANDDDATAPLRQSGPAAADSLHFLKKSLIDMKKADAVAQLEQKAKRRAEKRALKEALREERHRERAAQPSCQLAVDSDLEEAASDASDHVEIPSPPAKRHAKNDRRPPGDRNLESEALSLLSGF
jgi:ATP-dependent RNA helicase DDX10/DBP4